MWLMKPLSDLIPNRSWQVKFEVAWWVKIQGREASRRAWRSSRTELPTGPFQPERDRLVELATGPRRCLTERISRSQTWSAAIPSKSPMVSTRCSWRSSGSCPVICHALPGCQPGLARQRHKLRPRLTTHRCRSPARWTATWSPGVPKGSTPQTASVLVCIGLVGSNGAPTSDQNLEWPAIPRWGILGADGGTLHRQNLGISEAGLLGTRHSQFAIHLSPFSARGLRPAAFFVFRGTPQTSYSWRSVAPAHQARPHRYVASVHRLHLFKQVVVVKIHPPRWVGHRDGSIFSDFTFRSRHRLPRPWCMLATPQSQVAVCILGQANGISESMGKTRDARYTSSPLRCAGRHWSGTRRLKAKNFHQSDGTDMV